MGARKGSPRDLETLRRFRAGRERDLTIGRNLDAAVKDLKRAHAAAGGLDGAWDELAPEVVRGAASVERLSPNGVLTLRAISAAGAYEAEQWLRSGGFDALRSRCVKAITAYKIVVK